MKNEMNNAIETVGDVIENVEKRIAAKADSSPVIDVDPTRKRSQVTVIPAGAKNMSAAYKALERSKKIAENAKANAKKAAEKAKKAEEKAVEMEAKAIAKAEAMELKELEKAEKAVDTLALLELRLAKQVETMAKTREAIKEAKALIKKAEAAKAKEVK